MVMALWEEVAQLELWLGRLLWQRLRLRLELRLEEQLELSARPWVMLLDLAAQLSWLPTLVQGQNDGGNQEDLGLQIKSAQFSFLLNIEMYKIIN